MQGRDLDFVVLAVGVIAVSTAAVLIREAEAPALVIAAYRMSLASLPLAALAAVQRRPLLGGEGRARWLTFLSGLFLSLHFGFWIASVQQTSIITSVVLVTAQPLFVGLASGPLLGERPSAATWVGIAIAAVGAAVMVAEDVGEGADTLLGDLYAVLGAVFAAGYIMTGRSLRVAGRGWLPYVTVVYSTAAVALVIGVGASGDSFFGYSAGTYVLFGLLALVPQLIGHSAINRSLGYLPAASVAVAILGEPVGATVLGAVVLDETPTLLQAAGGVLVLAGVYAGLRSSGTPLPATAPD